MKSSDLKFLVDVGVGKAVELFLTEAGYDTKTIRTIDPQMPDEAIHEYIPTIYSTSIQEVIL